MARAAPVSFGTNTEGSRWAEGLGRNGSFAMRAWVLALFIIAISLPVYAQTGLRLGEASYGGTGCPAGTAAVVLSADKKTSA